MAGLRVAWSEEAKEDLREILKRSKGKSGGTESSHSLFERFRRFEKYISQFPKFGFATQYPNVRIAIVGNYQLIYEYDNELLWIVMVWDSRRNPRLRRLPHRLRGKK